MSYDHASFFSFFPYRQTAAFAKRKLTTSSIWQRTFPVHGQGVVIFNLTRNDPFSIIVKQVKRDKWIGVDVLDGKAQLVMKDTRPQQFILKSITDQYSGVDKGRKISYWLSYDRFHYTIMYGKGYRMEETTILKFDFMEGLNNTEQEQTRKQLQEFFNPTEEKLIELQTEKPRSVQQALPSSLDHDDTDSLSLIDIEKSVDFDYNPFVKNFPIFVYTGSLITFLDIEDGNYVFPQSLPQACQTMYYNIEDIELNYLYENDEVLLSDAIRYSINTEGCSLYRKLDAKANEFGTYKPDQTYLRVTLGLNYYNSPGVDYVLEIWPVGHFSPIHNHGNAYAIIKVLFGGLTVHLYNKQALTDGSTEHDQAEIAHVDVKAGDVTWLTPNWYATHKLKNDTKDFCATIQCYAYSKEDKEHWPYFEYLADDDGPNGGHFTSKFLPNSDYTFRELHDTVIAEYKEYLIQKQKK